MVKSAGHDVVEAADGQDAIASYREHPADLVITDMYLPGTDGMDVIMRLRAEFPAARIVAISGGGVIDSVNVLDAAKHAGAMDTLAKPFTLKALLEVMASSLAQGAPGSATGPSGA